MVNPLQADTGLSLTHPLHHLILMLLGRRRKPSGGYGKQKRRLAPTQLLKGKIGSSSLLIT
jgi:hypothetical protein